MADSPAPETSPSGSSAPETPAPEASTQVRVVIARPLQRVVEVAGDPRSLPRWAAGLAGAVVTPGPEDGLWTTESPMGRVLVRFAVAADPGVLDHEVTLPDGTTTLNRFRAAPHAEGTELVFTVARAPGASDEDAERDIATVRADLQRLKALLEDAA